MSRSSEQGAEPRTGRYRLAKQRSGAVFTEVVVVAQAAPFWTFDRLPNAWSGKDLPSRWAEAAKAGAIAAQEFLGDHAFHVRLTVLRAVLVDTTSASVALATTGAILDAAGIPTRDPGEVASALALASSAYPLDQQNAAERHVV